MHKNVEKFYSIMESEELITIANEFDEIYKKTVNHSYKAFCDFIKTFKTSNPQQQSRISEQVEKMKSEIEDINNNFKFEPIHIFLDLFTLNDFSAFNEFNRGGNAVSIDGKTLESVITNERLITANFRYILDSLRAHCLEVVKDPKKVILKPFDVKTVENNLVFFKAALEDESINNVMHLSPTVFKNYNYRVKSTYDGSDKLLRYLMESAKNEKLSIEDVFTPPLFDADDVIISYLFTSLGKSNDDITPEIFHANRVLKIQNIDFIDLIESFKNSSKGLKLLLDVMYILGVKYSEESSEKAFDYKELLKKYDEKMPLEWNMELFSG